VSTPLPPSGPRIASVTVGTYELRQALKATVAHCAKDKNAAEYWLRMHWVVDPQRKMIYNVATSGFTSGIAASSVLDDHLGVDETMRFSTSKGTATEILSMFPSNDSGGEDGITDVLQLDIHQEYLVITDVSGLLVGKQARWHLSHETDDTPDLRETYRNLLLSVRNRWVEPRRRTMLGGKYLALFAEAAVAYGRPLALEHAGVSPRSHTILVSCGDSFLGAIAPVALADEAKSEMEAHRIGWERRLGADLDVEFIPGIDIPSADREVREESSEQTAGAR